MNKVSMLYTQVAILFKIQLPNLMRVQITTASGKKEHKEVMLADHDPIWMEIRDLHIAEVSLSAIFRFLQCAGPSILAYHSNLCHGEIGKSAINRIYATIWYQKQSSPNSSRQKVRIFFISLSDTYPDLSTEQVMTITA